MGIVRGDPGQSAVDDGADPVDRQRRLRHVRGHDDPGAGGRHHGGILLGGGQFAMQGAERKSAGGGGFLEPGEGAANFIGPGHEDQHVPGRPLSGIHALQRVDGEVPGVRPVRRRAGEVVDIHRIPSPFALQGHARGQVRFQRLDAERGRHDADPQVGPGCILQTQRQREGQVAVQVALMKLVEQNRMHPGQIRIALHLPELLRYRIHARGCLIHLLQLLRSFLELVIALVRQPHC